MAKPAPEQKAVMVPLEGISAIIKQVTGGHNDALAQITGTLEVYSKLNSALQSQNLGLQGEVQRLSQELADLRATNLERERLAAEIDASARAAEIAHEKQKLLLTSAKELVQALLMSGRLRALGPKTEPENESDEAQSATANAQEKRLAIALATALNKLSDETKERLIAEIGEESMVEIVQLVASCLEEEGT